MIISLTIYFILFVQHGGVEATWSECGEKEGAPNDENDEAKEEKSFGKSRRPTGETRDEAFERSRAEGTNHDVESAILGKDLPKSKAKFV